MTAVVERPVLRWFGGKFLLADFIIKHFPEHRVYVEPYGGAASVLMKKPRSYSEVYNDLDLGVVTLFRVLQDGSKALRLKSLLEMTPFSREEFRLAHEPSDCEIEAARRMIIRSFMGFGADSVSNPGKVTGFRSNSNRSGTTPAHDWVNYSGQIPVFTERLRGVVIENRDAIAVMVNHDGPETLHFVDPPYVHETRGNRHGYNFEMSDADHVQMLECLKGLSGSVILCGYENQIYEDLSWRMVKRSAYADGARERTECLWMNERAEKGLNQMEFNMGAAI